MIKNLPQCRKAAGYDFFQYHCWHWKPVLDSQLWLAACLIITVSWSGRVSALRPNPGVPRIKLQIKASRYKINTNQHPVLLCPEQCSKNRCCGAVNISFGSGSRLHGAVNLITAPAPDLAPTRTYVVFTWKNICFYFIICRKKLKLKKFIYFRILQQPWLFFINFYFKSLVK